MRPPYILVVIGAFMVGLVILLLIYEADEYLYRKRLLGVCHDCNGRYGIASNQCPLCNDLFCTGCYIKHTLIGDGDS